MPSKRYTSYVDLTHNVCAILEDACIGQTCRPLGHHNKEHYGEKHT